MLNLKFDARDGVTAGSRQKTVWYGEVEGNFVPLPLLDVSWQMLLLDRTLNRHEAMLTDASSTGSGDCIRILEAGESTALERKDDIGNQQGFLEVEMDVARDHIATRISWIAA